MMNKIMKATMTEAKGKYFEQHWEASIGHITIPNICDDAIRELFTPPKPYADGSIVFDLYLSATSIAPKHEWKCHLVGSFRVLVVFLVVPDKPTRFPLWPTMALFLKKHFGCRPFFISSRSSQPS